MILHLEGDKVSRTEGKMSKSKNILFIIHSNNDLDHFLPLFAEFKKDKTKNITALAFYNKNELLKNQLHKHICKENDIELDSFTDMFGLKTLSGFMVKLYIYSSANVKKIQYTVAGYKRIKKQTKNLFLSPKDTIIRLMYYLSKKYIVLFSIFSIKNKHINKYFKNKNFDLAIIDLRTIDEKDLKLNPFNKIKKIRGLDFNTIDEIMFRFLAVAREKKIPILAIPHGPNYATEKPLDLSYGLIKTPFRPDYTIHCNITGKRKDKKLLGLKKSFLSGDPRYDPSWIKYVENVALKQHAEEIKKPKGKKVLLYIASYISRHSFHIPPAYHQQIHKDILSLVNDFPNIEIWLKFHPRLVFKVPITEYIDKDRQQNIKFFGNEVDTNALMALSDVVVSPESSILTIPILHKKPLIYYYRWKEKTGKVKITTTFDECPFILKAQNYDELKKQFEKAIKKNGYHIKDSDITFFYKKMFTVNSPYVNMTKKYIEIIEDILEKRI